MDAANGGSGAGDATPGAQAAAKAAGLPQTEDHWHVYVHKLRTWAPLPDAAGAAAAANGEDDAEVSLELVRPYLLLLVCVTDGAFLSYASADGDEQTNVLTTAEAPTADEVVAFLCRAMAEPRVLNASMRHSPKRAPCRPARVSFAHTASASALRGEPELWPDADVCPYVLACRPALEALGVRTAFAPMPRPLLDTVVRQQIEAAFNSQDAEWGTRLLPGLSDAVDGFTSDFGASLFGAAAAFLRAGVWAALPADAPLRVTYRIVLDNGAGASAAGTLSARVTSYVVRTGGTEGDEQGWGIAVYGTPHEAVAALAAAAAAADGDEDDTAEAPTRGQSLNFVGPHEMPFGDLDSLEAENWPLGPGDDCLPLFTKVELTEAGADAEASGPQLEVSRPELLELQAFELALSALSSLVEGGDLGAEGQAAAPGGAAVRCTTRAARGNAEEVLVTVERLPPGGGAALTGPKEEDLPPGTYL